MDRIFDKLIVFVCCLPSLAMVQVDASTVAALLTAVGVSAFCEVAASGTSSGTRVARGMTVASVLASAGYLVAACFLPVAVPFMALAVYDLAYRRTTAPVALMALLALGIAGSAGMSGLSVALALCSSAAAAALSLRTGRLEGQRVANVRERDELRERSLSLEQRNRDLIDRQEYEARLATLTERGRIAREIHDNVGHLLTRAIMQVEALKVVHAEDAQVTREFSTVSDTLHEALDTMRDSVHGLADDACDLSVQVRQVVDETCRDTGLTATCDISATTASPQVTACLTAVVREALSNTLRHADGATHVHIELLEHPGLWRLSIVDNGRPPASSHPYAADDADRPAGPFGTTSTPHAEAGSGARAGTSSHPSGTAGYGLMSMEQRVRGLGGTMSASYSEQAHGFVVYVSIPRKESAA